MDTGVFYVAVALSLLVLLPVLWVVRAVLLLLIRTVSMHRKCAALPGPPAKFFLGNAVDFSGNPAHQVTLKWAEEYGPLYRINFPGASAVVLTDPEEISRIVRVERMEKNKIGYVTMRQLTPEVQDNILTESDTPYWRAVRRAVTPAFSASNIKHTFPLVVSLTQRVADLLAAHGSTVPVDVDDVSLRVTVDVIGRFAFDRDFHATESLSSRNEALGAIQQLFFTMEPLMSNPLFQWMPWTTEMRAFYAARVRYGALLESILADLRAKPPPSHCLLSYLMGMTDPDTGKPLSHRRLKSETAIFWIAGFETTGHGLAWALFLIATNPEACAKLESELSSFGLLATPGSATPRAPTWQDLGAMKYLNACIQEALRLMPPVSGGTGRELTKDMVIKGHHCPKGALVWAPFYAVHRSSLNWPDANAFKPERWLQREPTANGSSTANGNADRSAADGDGMQAVAEEVERAAGAQAARGWLPFSEGPRNCVGMSLAMLELRAVLAILCGRFRFRLADEMGSPDDVVAASRMHVTLKPGEKGLLLHAVPRVPPA